MLLIRRMNTFVVLLLPVVFSAVAGSYVSPKDTSCRSDCKRNDHCQPGYVCERVGCRQTCVKGAIPIQPAIGGPLPVEGIIPIQSVVGGPLPVDGLRGDVLVPLEDFNGKMGGPKVNTPGGIFGMPVDGNVPMLPIQEQLPVFSDAILNDADRLFLCIDNCIASTQCLAGTDCVSGCKNLCKNGQSLIEVGSGLPQNPNHVHTINPSSGLPTNKDVSNGNLHVKSLDSYGPTDLSNNKPFPALPVNAIPGVATPGIFVDNINGRFDVKPIDVHVPKGHTGHKDVPFDQSIKVALPLDSIVPVVSDVSGQASLLGFNSQRQTNWLDTTGFGMALDASRLNPIDPLLSVKTSDSYVPYGHSSKDTPFGLGSNINVGISNGNPSFPIFPDVNQPVLVNSNGQILPVDINGVKHSHPDIMVTGSGSINTVIPAAPGDCYKECNRDVHCGPHKVCLEKGCKRVCVARINPIITENKTYQ